MTHPIATVTPVTPRPATVLPRAAALFLQQAARTPITQAEPLARVIAIERAIESIRFRYPNFFRRDPS